ncbi:MAG: hypothetical protein A2X64_07145 [Ignavibacteria bacterium GWF2_33_9]|nr:MAG: hypothetical protein A2X64_07145 [Ignavibacteria bacterium GWF2_33_9]
MKSKLIFSITFLIFLSSNYLLSEIISLQKCLDSFDNQSTSLKKIELYEKIMDLQKKNQSGNFLPKLNLVGQISYQSETFKLPFDIPTIPIKEIPKDQYYTAIEIEQIIFDGFAITQNKKLEEEKLKSNVLLSQVENHKIKEQIVKLYFSILILEKQKETLSLFIDDLNTKRMQFESLFNNGVILKSDLNQIDVEMLKRRGDLLKLNIDITNLKNTIIILSQLKVANFELALPSEIPIHHPKATDRPEYSLLTQNQNVLNENKNLINSGYYPKIMAFGKLGYASPNPNNFFKTDFSSFYNVGIRFQFNIFDWGTNYRKKEILEQNQMMMKQDIENFDRNFKVQIDEEKNNIEKYQNLVDMDEKIIELQTENERIAWSQKMNGTITTNEYIIQNSNLLKSKISLDLNKFMKLNSEYNLLIKSNQLK